MRKNKEEDIELTNKEVFDILQFAQAYSSSLYQTFTVDLVNSRQKDITLNPVIATEEQITKALNNPKESEDILRGIAEYLEVISMPYKRSLLYLASLPSFDFTYTVTNIQDEKEYSSKAYKKDLASVQSFFDKFDMKREFSIAVRQLLRGETFAYSFREEGDKFILQELPSSQCKIVARSDFGFVMAYNFYWFMKPGVPIDSYHPWFKKKFDELFGGKVQSTPFNPAIPLDKIGYTESSNWVLWSLVPVDVGGIWKFTPEISTKIPFFAPVFGDFVLQPLFRSLSKSKAIQSAQKIIMGEVGMLSDKTKGASVRDSMNISSESLGKFLALVKSAIGDYIKTSAIPIENIQGISFPTTGEDAKTYENFLRTATSSTGINSNLIFSSQQKMNSIESQASLALDELLVNGMVYSQFENFLNYHVNKYTTKFKFKFVLEGSNLWLDRKRRMEDAVQMANFGAVLPQKFAAAMGMSPFDFEKQLAMGRAEKWVEKLTPIVSAFNMSKESQNEKGRPQKKDDELSDSGNATRDSGSNLEKGGEV